MFDSRDSLSDDIFNALFKKLKNIKRRYPDGPYVRIVLGDVLFSKENFRDAEDELRYTIRMQPDSPVAHMILANILTYGPDELKRAEAINEAEDGARPVYKNSNETKGV